MKLLKYGNAKLNNQLIFSIPANKAICGRECPGCYATKFQRLYPNVLPSRETKYQASLQADFTQAIIDEVNSCKKTITAVRIHESGEFYSQTYIDNWQHIATSLPKIQFYAFTKRMKDFNFSALMSLPNVVIIDSIMHGPLNYAKAADLKPGVFICPATQNKTTDCGIDCDYCWTKTAQQNSVQFVKH